MDTMSTTGCALEGFRLLEFLCEVIFLIFLDNEDLSIGDSLVSLCSLLLETIGVANDTLGFSLSVEDSLASSHSSRSSCRLFDSSLVVVVLSNSSSGLSSIAFSPWYYIRVRSYCSVVTFSLEF